MILKYFFVYSLLCKMNWNRFIELAQCSNRITEQMCYYDCGLKPVSQFEVNHRFPQIIQAQEIGFQQLKFLPSTLTIWVYSFLLNFQILSFVFLFKRFFFDRKFGLAREFERKWKTNVATSNSKQSVAKTTIEKRI